MSDEDDSSGWQLTESDPGVFTELLKTLGVPLIVDDLYSLDPDSLASLQPLHALIFLFKWIPTSTDSPSTSSGEYDPEFPGFFAHQVVNNACATLAVLNALGNIPSLPVGPQLADLNNFTAGMDPQTRGMVITSADWLREAHNALSPPSAISLDGLGLPKKSEDAYHFVVYLPVMGALYELDGLKQYPVRHGSFDEQGEGWIKTAREVIERRIATYPVGALEFSLLALRDDPLPSLQAQLQEAQSSGNSAVAAEILATISNENSKRKRWAFENSLRKHNHVGLIHALLVALAKGGGLHAAQTQARTVMQTRIEKKKASGEGMDED
ncbi:Ubiquitin carboxyl-terminal hydrolase isozyme L5 [Hypsizygus marmoreus]|uniref:Ubiquitin carboxyl-terminal hydrolase n=1 Tax=Hypsizygus marmoreus TaxID=39966 RepID=A0A369K1J8_HYPMA|nr:Ubiquitin carboxyl-terminal hydrolase isozyme L5 [Hypsizygus marmoreus]